MDLQRTETGRVTSRKTTYVAGSETYEIEVFDHRVTISVSGQNGSSSTISWKLDFAVEIALCILKGMNRENLLKALLSLQDFHPGEFVVPGEEAGIGSESYSLGFASAVNDLRSPKPQLASYYGKTFVDEDFLEGWRDARRALLSKEDPFVKLGRTFGNMLKAWPASVLSKLICGLELIDWEGIVEEPPPLIALLERGISVRNERGMVEHFPSWEENEARMAAEDVAQAINLDAPHPAGQSLDDLPEEDPTAVHSLIHWIQNADEQELNIVASALAGQVDGRDEVSFSVKNDFQSLWRRAAEELKAAKS